MFIIGVGATPALAQEAAAPATAPVQTTQTTQTSLAARVDCLHDFNADKGSSQDCLKVTGLRLSILHRQSADLRGRLRLDPFATPKSGKADTPLRDDLPTMDATPFGLVDDYALIWSPRPNLEVAVESFDGSAKVPSMSGLSLANSFADTGWEQTALTVTYNLSTFTDMKVTFAAGNGEGESGRNLDPQQYFGFGVDASIIKGVRAGFGVSMDGNDVGSDERTFLATRYSDRCGFVLAADKSRLGHSTQRMAAGVGLDGTLAAAPGLRAGIGWQRNVFSDLDKKSRGGADLTELGGCARLDPGTVFVEDTTGGSVNTVQRTTYVVNASYRVFERYFVGADYTARNIDSGAVDLFQICDGYSGTTCSVPGSRENSLSEDAFTVGGGMDLTDGLRLTVEYFRSSYDKKYAQVFYDARDGKASDEREIFNARLAANWQ
jgi:hypothetical protein